MHSKVYTKELSCQLWDHSGQGPVQFLKNNERAIEQSDWLILVNDPLILSYNIVITNRDGLNISSANYTIS